MVPGHLVPHNWSPIDWSLWTNGPQPIQSPWTNGPQIIWSPWTNGPRNILFVQGDRLWGSGNTGTKLVGDHLSRGTKLLGTICPGGPNFGGPFVQGDQIFGNHLSMGTEFEGDRLSRGINFMGIVCPGGQEVGDRKSGDQIGLGPIASQPILGCSMVILMFPTFFNVPKKQK